MGSILIFTWEIPLTWDQSSSLEPLQGNLPRSRRTLKTRSRETCLNISKWPKDPGTRLLQVRQTFGRIWRKRGWDKRLIIENHPNSKLSEAQWKDNKYHRTKWSSRLLVMKISHCYYYCATGFPVRISYLQLLNCATSCQYCCCYDLYL